MNRRLQFGEQVGPQRLGELGARPDRAVKRGEDAGNSIDGTHGAASRYALIEARAPAFEKRVNRRGALTERGRDFRNGEAVEIAEDERSPLRGRDGGERGQSAVAIFLTTLVERDLAELGVRLERRLPLDPLLLAVMIEQLVPVVGSSRRSAEGRARRSRETLPGQDRAPRPLRRRAPSMRSRTCHSLRRTERHVFIAVRKEGETILRPAVAR
jgi:hypothetical protein